MTSTQRKSVLSRLGGRSAALANEAAHEVFADPDPALGPCLISILKRGSRVFNRVEAAYVLGIMEGEKRTLALERTLNDKNENLTVRSFAAESLVLGHRRNTHLVLLRNLEDPSKEIRFWCAYALGEIGEKKALPALKRLAENDHRIVKGWWAVSKEARNAIRAIQKNSRRKCAFCVG